MDKSSWKNFWFLTNFYGSTFTLSKILSFGLDVSEYLIDKKSEHSQ